MSAVLNLFRNYRPHEGQRALHNAGTRFVAVCAGVRSGKTHGTAREFLRRIYADRASRRGPLHYWAVAPTYDLCEVQEREIVGFLRREAPALLAGIRHAERRIELRGEILLEFKSAHRPELLVGVGLDGLWIDEAARITPEAWTGSLRMRLSDRLGFALFSTTPLARNWFHEEIWRRGDPHDERRDPSYARVHFTTAQNSAVPHLACEVEQARRELPARYFAREYLASFDTFQGQVYEEFDRARHVVPESAFPAAFAEVRVGVDWGFRNPGAMVVVGRDGDGVWWVIDERVRTRTPVESPAAKETWVGLARQLAERYGASVFVCDPSRPENIRALRVAGLPAVAGDNAVAPGIQRVATLLHGEGGAARLRIGEGLAHLLSEISDYRWREDDPAAEEPVKQDDHALDALRYALNRRVHKPAFW